MPGTTLHVRAHDAGVSLLGFLSGRLINESKTRLRRLVAGGSIRVNGKAVATSTVLEADDAVSLPADADVGPPPSAEFELEVLCEHGEHLVLNKPSGVTVLPGRRGAKDCLSASLVALLNRDAPAGGPFVRPHIVHRLDRETSGVLLVAKSEEAARKLSLQFQRRAVHKCYLGVIEGVLPRDELTIDIPLSHSRGSLLEMVPDPGSGKPAATQVVVREAFGHFCLLEIRPLTGRQHQIRVHLSAIGYPLAVDAVYGRRSRLKGADFNETVRARKLWPERVLLERCPLHAHSLRYRLPESGCPTEVTAPMPHDLESFLEVLRRHDKGTAEARSGGTAR